MPTAPNRMPLWTAARAKLEQGKIIDVYDMASIAGVSETVMRNLIASGAIEHVRSGRSIYITAAAARRFLGEG